MVTALPGRADHQLPNFLHLGPGKTGSTWLHETLMLHPEVYLTEAKDLYFFSRYYDRGLTWYHKQFQNARPGQHIIGEASPDYLTCAEAPHRIRACLGPDVRLMVTLRDPAARAFSAYLHRRKQGLTAPSFRQTLETSPELLEAGRYGTQLERYLNCFERAALHVAVFDDLRADPQAFLDGVTDWLAIARLALAPELLGIRQPASDARWLPLATLAQRAANVVRGHDGAGIVGRVKRSALVQRVLYRPMGDNRPAMLPEDAAFVRELLESEVIGAERQLGIPLRQRWGWPTSPDQRSAISRGRDYG
jgi:Sulfotransferase domain